MAIYSSRIIKNDFNKTVDKNELEDNEQISDSIEDYEDDTGIHIIDKEDSLDELEDENDKWQSMTYYQRKMSDEKSLELFGKTNKERYEDNKSALLKIKESFNDDATLSNIEIAKNYSNDSGTLIMYPTETYEDLNNLWNDWNLMVYNQRYESDERCREIFGCTNKELYNKCKSEFLKNDDKEDLNINTYKDITQSTMDTKKILDESTKYDLGKMYLEKSKTVYDNIYEDLIVKNQMQYILNKIDSEEALSIDLINDLPYFTPEEMEDMGVFSNNNYYGEYSDNKYINDKMTTASWFDEYKLISKGIIPENSINMIKDWMFKLKKLYSDFDQIKESNIKSKINSRKQSILELGWNPEINFNPYTRKMSSEKLKSSIREMYNKNKIYDISNIEYSINEASNENNDKFPIYVVLSFTNSTFGKGIQKFTNGIYSHASISLDSKLDKMYSYNLDLKGGGFKVENLKNYIKKEKNTIICVYAIFVDKLKYSKIKYKLDYYISNINNTKYSILNIFGILMNKPMVIDNDMVCSQFVDSIFKFINIDISGKNSSLVTPNDIYLNSKNNLYKIYEDRADKYKYRDIDNKVKGFLSNNVHKKINEESYIYENYIKPYETLLEVKDIPVQFDKDGNMFIKNIKNIDFESEYSKSHKLLLSYEKNNNLEGIKYELSKLWFMNILLEKKIYNSKESDKNKYHKVRARILNDFSKYLKLINSLDNNFNFTEYYENTPFSDSVYKVNKHTLKYSVDLAKDISKLFI